MAGRLFQHRFAGKCRDPWPRPTRERLAGEGKAAKAQLLNERLADYGCVKREPYRSHPKSGRNLGTVDTVLKRLYETTLYQVTRKFLNCHGSLVSRFSGNRPPRSLSGVQSLYLPTTGPR